MKKRILSMILVLLMIVSLFPSASFADGPEDNDPVNEPYDDTVAEVPAEQEEDPSVQPEDLTEDSGIAALPPEGDEPQEAIASGTCGGNLKWEFDGETLTISGSGAMNDYGYYGNASWYTYRARIRTIELPDGITKIGDQAFLECSGVTRVTIPENVVSIGSAAFKNCTGLSEITFTGHAPTFGNNCFYNVTATVQYPDDGTWIDSVFQNYGGNLTWAQDIGTVLFDPNGGTVATVSKVVIKDHPYGELPIPERTGYCFIGWCTASEGGELVTADTIVQTTESHTLYAHWIANTYNVYFDANGGAVFPETITVAYNSSYGELPIPERTGYRFAGWYTTAEGGELVTAETIVQVRTDHTLFAHWTVNTYIVTYNANGGESAPEAQTKTHDVALTLSTTLPTRADVAEESFIVTLDPNGGSVSSTSLTAERTTGFSFNIWNTSADGSGEAFAAGATFTLNCDTTLYAQWNSTTVTAKVTLPTPTRNGYTFKGWAISATATGGSFFSYTPSGNVTLYAIWEKNIIASGTCGDELTWTLDEDGLLSVSGIGKMGSFRPSLTDYRESISDLVISEGVTSIYNYAFFNCKELSNVSLPSTITEIESGAFSSCEKLSSIELPSSLASIGSSAFSWCSSLSFIEIPRGVSAIPDNCFIGCKNLKEIKLPNTVTSFGGNAFDYCSCFDKIIIEDLSWWLSLTVSDYTKDIPCGQLYLNDDALTDVVIPEGITVIRPYAFFKCEQLSSISLPEGVREISKWSFGCCNSLSSVNFPSSLTKLGECSFDECYSLLSIQIPDGVHVIPEGCFANCRGLLTVSFSFSLTEIGSSAFSGCYALGSIDIPEGVTSIKEYCFASCSSLSQVTLPSTLTEIGGNAFRGCSALPSIEIPEGVVEIPEYCFYLDTSLEQIIIPTSIGSIGKYAFRNCAFSEIYFVGNAPAIGSYAFSDVVATAFYPGDDPTWTGSIFQNYGGTISWVPYFILAFDSNGGTNAPSNQIKLNNVELTLPADHPTRADEKASYTVTLDANGGSVEPASLTAERTTSFSFSAWNTAEDGSGDSYAPGASYTANASVTLYAQWDSSTSTAAVDLPTPTRGGYLFKGWAVNTSALSGITGSYTPTEDITLYAIWERDLPTTGARFTVGGGRMTPGNEIRIPIRIENNPGLVSIEITVAYDESVLEWTGVEEGEYGGIFDGAAGKMLTWYAEDPALNETKDGVFATLVFRVKDDAPLGTTQVTVRYNEDYIYNANEENQAFAVVPGEIEIISYIAGDINNDGVLNNKDVTRLMRYVKYHDVQVNEAALDVNGDGTLNNKDVTRLMRYVKYHDVEIH